MSDSSAGRAVWDLKRSHITVLLSLLRGRKLLLADIKRALRSSDHYWVLSVMEYLKDLDLVREERIGRFRVYTLTAKGERLARELERLARMIRE